jgi:hypothetical protein
MAQHANVRRMKALSVYMTDSLAQQIEHAAKKARRPVSSYVRLVLEDAVGGCAAAPEAALVGQPRRSNSLAERSA